MGERLSLVFDRDYRVDLLHQCFASWHKDAVVHSQVHSQVLDGLAGWFSARSSDAILTNCLVAWCDVIAADWGDVAAATEKFVIHRPGHTFELESGASRVREILRLTRIHMNH